MSSILIIEDEILMQNVLAQLCEDEGYEVYKAFNGIEGIRICSSESVDLIITDILMPEKDGIETIREIKLKFPRIKIIAISGGGHIEAEMYLNVAKIFGADQIFTKPFKRDKLLAAVRELLDGHSHRDFKA